MSEVKIFNNEEFGEIRTVTIDGEPWFCMADICKALDIGNVSQAKTRLKEDGVIINEVIILLEEIKIQILLMNPTCIN